MKNNKLSILLCLLLLAGIVRSVAQTNITRVEYYIDNDPGFGLATNVSITPATVISNLNIPVNPLTLPAGMHRFAVRAKNANGAWSMQNVTLMYKPYALSGSSSLAPNLSKVEYYIDHDPGYGLGTNVSFPAGTSVSNLLIPVNPNTIASGIHTFNVRARDANGAWSLQSSSLFFKPYVLSGTAGIAPDIIKLEYYIDTDPGFGQAINVPVTPGTTISNQVVAINTAILSEGVHNVNVRAKDANGHWSMLSGALIFKPYASSGTLIPLPDITRIEYYVDTDPGFGQATEVSISSGTNIANIVIPINPDSLGTGVHKIAVRALDANGKWSLTNEKEFHHSADAISSTPVLLSGLNADVIAEVPNDALGSTTTSFDYNYGVLMAPSYNPSGPSSLPANGIINSFFRPGVSFQLGPYNGNNTLSMTGNVTSTLNFVTQVSAKDVFVLGAGANGACPVDITINYTDLSTESFPGKVFPDWFGGADYAIKGIGKTYRYYNTIENYENEPRLYTIKLQQSAANYSKPIQSITFHSLGSLVNIMAVNVGNACSGTPNPGNTIASSPAVCPNATFTLQLQNGFLGAGISYQWQRANNAAFTQGVVNLGTSYSQQTTQTTARYYRCQVTCSAGGTSFSTPVLVNMNTLPNVSVNASPAQVCYGLSTSLNATGASSYTWTNSNATTNSITVAPVFNTTYTVTGTDANGCTATSNVTVVVNPLPSVTVQNAIGCSSSPITLVGLPAGGVFSVTNPYTGPSTSYTYTYTNSNGCTAVSNVATITTYTSLTYYQDNDHDGYGNAGVTQNACAQPLGYVVNGDDCNDNDSLAHPGQVWYIDNDGDDYGTGAFVTQCARPLHGYIASELVSTTGDCDDANPNINQGAQYFTFSGTPNFVSSLASPLYGDAYTQFNFEVNYVDANGALPPATFPRVILDYEGNGSSIDFNDRVIIMTAADAGDLNTTDGKKYVASITSLPVGVNYQTSIQTSSNGCTTNIGPFNYPDVLQQPDIEIFANDITFSVPHPPVSSPLTVNATVHNESDYAATNFVVHLRNQYDTTLVFPNITVGYLPPHGTYNVSWNITTPSIPAWCPMEVSIDYTNVINETNELDNVAIRPFINGNYNLPGGIEVASYVNPSVGYSGAYTTLYGSAHYFGTAVPLPDSSVAGATTTFTIVETGATYTTYTNSYGNFYYNFPNPVVPGIYHIQGTVTDFTLTGNFNDTFEVLMPVITNCTLPDLGTGITASNPYGETVGTYGTITLVEGDHLTGTVLIPNTGLSAAGNSVLNISNSGSSPSLGSSNVPALAAGNSFTKPFNVVYNTTGYYYLYATADATTAVAECDENNTTYIGIHVLPALPDISPYSGPGGTIYDCQISSVSFTLANYGGSSTGSFNCTIVKKLNGITISSVTQTIPSIPAALYYPSNYYTFSIPFIPASAGEYTFDIQCDLPANIVNEYSETNNTASYAVSILQCKPNLVFETCESFDVASGNGDYTAGSNITLKGVLANTGNLAYNGNVNVRYQLSSGSIFNEVVNVNLPPGTSVPVSKVITAPPPATNILTITADPTDLIDELSEADNVISDNMCWDFYIDSVFTCGYSNYFWNHSFLVNQAAYLTIGIHADHLYDADTLHVKFEVSGPGLSGMVNLGNGVLYNVEQTCYCPLPVTLPTSFVFPQIGTYTFRMTVDPDSKYTECNEANNVLIRTVNVVNLPDMRILSQHIAPSLLNPQPGQPVSLNVTYQNIGYPNIADQMKLKVLVDNVPLSTINNVGGLVTGDNATVAIPNTWSSNVVGIHIVRAIIDADNVVSELDETNNEATRAIVVGQSANLHFKVFTSLTLFPPLNASINVRARIGNSGDLACQGDLQLFYVNNNSDTILFNTIHVNLNAHDSVNLIIPWTVLDNKTTIIGKLVNASVLEYTYDDNNAQFELGKMFLLMSNVPACNNNTGSITALPQSGEPPYSYLWNNGSSGQTLTGPVGTYTVTVTDMTGKTATAISTIVVCPPVTLNANLFIEGYYEGGGLMTPVLVNQGQLNAMTDVDTVTVELHDTISPYNVIASYDGILQTNGNVVCFFPSNVNGHRYYVVVRHRLLITTWSAEPVTMSTVCSYLFSNGQAKAYGSNQREVSPGLWAMYACDMNQDENVDLIDLSILENDIGNFEFGYLETDINGDGNVDLLDSPLMELNIANFIYSIHP